MLLWGILLLTFFTLALYWCKVNIDVYLKILQVLYIFYAIQIAIKLGQAVYYDLINWSRIQNYFQQIDGIYLLMLFCAYILPLIIFIPKFSKNVYTYLIVAIGINIGRLFELLVILIAMNRDYLPTH
jgi:hypothetical protein